MAQSDKNRSGNDSKSSNDRAKAVELTIASIEKQFGKGTIMRLGSDEPLVRELSVIPTGSLSLDMALGVGGVVALGVYYYKRVYRRA